VTSITLRNAAIAVALSVLPAAGETRLPFPDGAYATDAALCPLSPSERVEREGDIVGNKLRIITGNKLENGYEMSCLIERVRISGNSVRFEAACMAEGETEKVDGAWRKVSATSFRIGARLFTLCP
jgi:hypothetical protein